MPPSLLIRGGVLASSAGLKRADIVICGDRIAAVGEASEFKDASSEIDAAGKVILPGLVDAHVHIPGYLLSTRLEGFVSATMAAACGGVTTVMLMPTDDPRTINGRYFNLKRRIGDACSFVDFAIQALVGPETDRVSVEEMASLGAVSFELFLAYGGSPGFIVGHEDFELSRLMQLVHEVGGLVGVTPHSASLVARLTHIERNYQAGSVREFPIKPVAPASVGEFAATRPVLSEALGVARACTVASEIGARLHLRGLSAARSVDLARRLAGGGALVSTEVMSHHLLFEETEARALGPYGIIVPPIRSQSERDALRRRLQRAEIDMVVSDHSPVLREDKELGWANIWRTAPGMPGLQTLLLSMLTLVDGGELTLSDVVRSCCEAPAREFGLHPRKGCVAPGSDADLVIINPTGQTLIDDLSQHSRAGYTTMKGRSANATIDMVFLRGRPIVHNGAIVATPSGRFVRP